MATRAWIMHLMRASHVTTYHYPYVRPFSTLEKRQVKSDWGPSRNNNKLATAC